MALKPVLLPTNTITLPISKKEITVRPYTAKEEKVLLMTNRENSTAVSNSMIGLVYACCDGSLSKKEVEQLPVQDVMYAVLQLNIASVGADKTLTRACSDCGEDIKFKVNVSDVGLSTDDWSDVVQFNEELSVKMKSPTLHNAFKLMSLKETSKDGDDVAFNALIEVLASSIDQVVSGAEVTNASDCQKSELINWVETLPRPYFVAMSEWLRNIPSLQKNISYRCLKCGKQHDTMVQDVMSFFS